MLAYVFWHRARAEASGYELALADFHRTLAASPPQGFRRSWSFRADRLPWLGGGPGYEDWYLVEDFAALADLNEAAVSSSRKGPHDAVAALAADGAGGVLRLVSGAASPETATTAAWLSKPAGTSYEEFLAGLTASRGALWQRQMVLGPAPEFCLQLPAGAEAPAGAARVKVTPIA